MKDAMYLVRMYEPEADHRMIEEWAAGHGKVAPPREFLPKLGVISKEVRDETREDLAALWLYMDNSVGVCFAEHAIAKPGLSVKRAKRALLRALDCLRKLAGEMSYGVMLLHTPEGMARHLAKEGFHQAEKGLCGLWTIIKENK